IHYHPSSLTLTTASHLPPLHTLFPTRRSSDLISPTRSGTPLGSCSPHTRAAPRSSLRRNVSRRSSDGCCLDTRPAIARPARDVRSEEHTSELQSRGHLVCRLLLEKKNYTLILQ